MFWAFFWFAVVVLETGVIVLLLKRGAIDTDKAGQAIEDELREIKDKVVK